MSATVILPLLIVSLALSVLFAGVAFTLIKTIKISNPATLTAIWSVAFFLSALTPLFSFMPGGTEFTAFQTEMTAPVQPVANTESAPISPIATQPTTGKINVPTFGFIAVILVAFWCAGFVWRCVRLSRDAISIFRLRQESQPIKVDDDDFTIPARVAVLTHPMLIMPIAAGILRPAIILPSCDAENINSDATQHAIAHEFAHIQRGDLVMSFAESVVLLVFWWNPLMWKMRAEIATNREMACDDLTVSLTKDAQGYSSSLIEFAERIVSRPKKLIHGAALAASGHPSNLNERISRLMSDNYADSTRRSISKTVLAGAAFTALTASVAIAAPRIAIETSQFNNDRRMGQSEPTSDTEALGRSLVRAISERLWSEADALIAAGADVNAVLHGDGTPLIAAVNEGSNLYASKLIALGADVNAEAPLDETALISAVRKGDRSMVQLLIDAGADVNQSAQTENGETRSPLGEAVRLNHSRIETILRNAGAA